MIELVGLLKKDNKTIEIISEKQIGYIIDLINLIMDQKINARQGKVVMQEIYKDSLDPIQSIKNHGFKQIVNPNEIAALLQPIIDSNKDIVSQYDKRPERVEKMILGLLMKQTQGQANPVISTQVLRQLIKK
ncbi:MAG: hypothetical protein MJ233_03660 [Mycoplasmoidaceae bacterium]|nr:hypothetical protein [Mycoplasmoidaceae bacterium]